MLKLNQYDIIGLDIINDYYDIDLKYDRLEHHGIQKENIQRNKITKSSKYKSYNFIHADLADHDFIVKFMIQNKFDYVVNLASQAGVR